MTLLLGDLAPDFAAQTSLGPLRFHDWLGAGWGLLCSHPADFTPVCSTEMAAAARLVDDFARRDVRLASVSAGTADSHRRWAQDLEHAYGSPVGFPLVADPDLRIARLYGMLHPGASDTVTVRAAFVIDPAKRVRLTINYPFTTGRNFAEILRVVESLQLADAHPVVTPADWSPGDDVLIAHGVADADAPGPVHAVLPYVRMVPQPTRTRYQGG